jgi:spore coat polysaccharide biosynthesis protein SpsF
LMDLHGESVLSRVVNRARRFTHADLVVVATSILPEDDAVADECARLGVDYHRGSAPDVLDRFRGAAEAFDADVCVRITADCPLIDPDVSDMIIDRFLTADPPVSYASNKIPQSFPRGLDTEVFSRDALEQAAREAKVDYQRVHVTPYFYQNPGLFELLSITSDVDRADWRWTVDTPEDLQFVRAVYEHFDGSSEFSWLDVVALVESQPSLAAINAHVVQKSLEQG